MSRRVRIDTSTLVARHQPSRHARFLPSCVLALVLVTMGLVTLSHVAVIHRATLPQPMAAYTSLTTLRLASVADRHRAQKQKQQQQRATSVAVAAAAADGRPKDRPFRLEPLISRNVAAIESNAILVGQAFNERRVVQLALRAQRPDDQWTPTTTDNSTAPCASPSPETSPLMPYCHQVPPHLHGPLFPVHHSHNYTMEEVVESNSDVCLGGWWRPERCTAWHQVAIVIPYRDRSEHLITLLAHLHPILKRQQIHYRIFVVEQQGSGTFNKGILMNAAFTLAMRDANFHCFVFHDVDLIPEDDRNMYSCPDHPRHMSVAVDEFKYKLPYSYLVGGVFSIQTKHFLQVNGYSNMYWGWGGEDDDMSSRILQSNLAIIRPPAHVARYRMIKHVKRKPLIWKIRGKLLGTAKKRMKYDGLNTLNYTLLDTSLHQLYTKFTIDVGINPFLKDIT